jgi:hypothetical protein
MRQKLFSMKLKDITLIANLRNNSKENFKKNVIQLIPGRLAPEVEPLDTAEPIGSVLAGACERL